MWFLKKTNFFVFCLLCCHGFIAKGQAQWSVGSYLASATNAAELQMIKDQLAFLDNNNLTSPRLREAELRVRTNDLQSTPDDFRLRISPLNPLERRANMMHVTLVREQLATQQQVDFAQLIATRYYLLANYWYALAFANEQSTLRNRYETLINATTASNVGKDLIRLEKRLFSAELRQLEAEANARELVFNIMSSTNIKAEPTFDGFELVTVEQISRHLVNSEISPEESIFLANEQNKLKIGKAEWEIKRQESFSNIGFLQAEYRANNDRSITETLGLQMGIRLPLQTKDRPELGLRKLALIEDQQKLAIETSAMEAIRFNLTNDLTLKINQYELISTKLKSLTTLKMESVTDTETLLELEDYQSDITSKKNELYKNILISYIKWLHHNGLLSKTPYVNYFSAKRELLPID